VSPVRTGAENLAPTGIRSPDHPAPLYRLSYPAHCLVNQSFIKIGQEQQALYMKTTIHFITSRSVLLGIRNVSDKNFRESQNTHIMLNNVFSKIVPFMR
jgi:hypothetical protein